MLLEKLTDQKPNLLILFEDLLLDSKRKTIRYEKTQEAFESQETENLKRYSNNAFDQNH